MAHSAGSVRTYFVVYVTLIGLTLLTYLSATRAHLGEWEIPVALGIAATKTVLVGLFFMHLIHSSRLTWLVVAMGLLFLGIMLGGTLTDYWTRNRLPAGAPPGAKPAVPSR